MNNAKLKPSDWLMMVGGAVMLFGMVLDWAKLGPYSGNGPFDYFFTGGIAWILTVAVGVVAALLAFGAVRRDAAPWTLILLGASGLATLLMLLRLILGGGEEQGLDLDRDTGMYVAFIAAVVALVGAVMKFTESGGNLKDLTDVNKIKGEFQQGRGGGTGTPPPPPSGGGTPPPPPPPGS